MGKLWDKCCKLLKSSQAVVVMAGAGMGVDSGLPDFRGPEGFWKAYPPMKRLGLSFPEMSTPSWFREDPAFAWGFFGHRYNLYKDTTPHDGFRILLEIAHSKPDGYFVLTSNVDGHFQRAGFAEDKIYEIHGSICYHQCCGSCPQIWETHDEVTVDAQSFRATSPLPSCPYCNNTARPNILMFDDFGFNSTRTIQQSVRYEWFADDICQKNGSLTIIEIGCGLAVPTVRWHGENLLNRCENGHLIRINPCDGNTNLQEDERIIHLPITASKAAKEFAKRLGYAYTT